MREEIFLKRKNKTQSLIKHFLLSTMCILKHFCLTQHVLKIYGKSVDFFFRLLMGEKSFD